MRGKADQDGNADEWVSAEECYEYLAPRVNNWAVDSGITQGQNPQLYDADPGTDIDLVSIEAVVYEPSTWTVPGDFPNIQNAINAAKEGDIIILSTGVYFGGDSVSPGQVIIDKEVTITSTNPDDPDVVEATVINCAGYASRGVYFTANAGPGAVLAGITIANGTWYVIDADDGEQPSEEDPAGHRDGYDGGWAAGGGIFCGIGSRPTIINCVVRDCYIIGGNAGSGAGAEEEYPAGHGGWGGAAYGGGVYIGRDSSPTFKNCTVRNCTVTGGNGGDGGSSFEQDGVTIWNAGHGGNWSNDFYFPWQALGKLADYRYYSGYGGGVYCDQSSSPTFISCTFAENTAQGGMSGIGGNRPWTIPEPVISYEIPAYGGGVYCAKNTTVQFVNCTFVDNVAVKPGENYHIDPYLGHGGGMAFEETASVMFAGCGFMDNEASLGGGLWSRDNVAEIADCNFIDNLAYQGAALHANHGWATIDNCYFNGNFAGAAEDDVDVVAGEGAGIYSASVAADIFNCRVIGNESSASGGGIFLTGVDPASPVIANCLIVDNEAGRDGGGISVNWFAEPTIANCTIIGNSATGDFGDLSESGFGGGLYCSYDSNSVVIDSIFWDNYAAVEGAQIAVARGSEHDPRPSALDITYSDIGPAYAPSGSIGPGKSNTATSSADGSEKDYSGPVLVDAQTIYDRFDAGQETVKVIVGLAEPVELREAAKANKSSKAAAAVLKAEIASRQSAVLSLLSPDEFGLRHRYQNLTALAGDVTIDGLDKLLADPMVMFVERDKVLYPLLAQGIALINATQVRLTYNGQGLAIAVADSGVDYTHPMLGGGTFPNSKVIGGYDTGDGDADPIPEGDAAHGTACAGIAAGDLGAVGDYIGGVAHNAKIYALKITAGASETALVSAEIAAWDWCITHKNDDSDNPIMIITNSFGGGRYLGPEEAEADNLAEAAAATRVAEAGITLLASSGNDGWCDSMGAPAAFSNVISVGAVYDAALGNFSWCVDEGSCAPIYATVDCETGFAADDTAAADRVTVYSNTADFLDILAPSNNAYTTDIVGPAGYMIGDYDSQFGGTSAACPYAAGAVACIQSAAMAEFGQYLAPAEVIELLAGTGRAVTDTKVNITKPRVDLAAAVAGIHTPGIYVEDGCTLNGRIIYNWNPASFAWAPGDHNIEANPRFVGDYYLSQTLVTGQTVQSPCVDAGSDHASNICFGGVCLSTYTTRTDKGLDKGTVDMGYHHSLAREEAGALEPCSYCDLVRNGLIDLEDFASLSAYWLDVCISEPWCPGFTSNYYVGLDEFIFFAECWLAWDDQGPEPDPSTWKVVPYADTSTSITMTATTAFDRWGWGAEYYFNETSGTSGGTDSGWQSEPDYKDTDLVPGQEYTYRVRTRDKSPYLNTSGWSTAQSATPITDNQPPAPAGWADEPYALGSSSITMTALIATDPEGSIPVQYAFACTTAGGHDRDWDTSTSYTDTGLTPNTQYCYRVNVRDSSLNWNESGWSTEACATTEPLGGENLPPYPDGGVVGDPAVWDPEDAGSGWSGEPRAVAGGHYMRADGAIDPEGEGVEYYFECVTSGHTANSGWQNPALMGDAAREWTNTEAPAGTHYCYRCKYRDTSPEQVESAWSSTDCVQ